MCAVPADETGEVGAKGWIGLKWFKLLAIVLLSLGLVGCAALGFVDEHVEAVASVEGDHPLVGTWEWVESESWLYVFNADGSGSSGTGRMIQHFTWEVCDEGHLILAFRSGNTVTYVYWYMQLESNILLLTNRDDISIRHAYIRVAGS